MKKLGITISFILITMLSLFSLSGCKTGELFEVEGWTLFKFKGLFVSKEARGLVNIIEAKDASLVKDGILHIPAKIGEYDINGFGRPGEGMFGSDAGSDFRIHEDLVESIERIQIAEGVYVGQAFYGDFEYVFGKDATVYVEFLSNTFENINSFGGGGIKVICIIPDGSTDALLEKRPSFESRPEKYIELSDYLEGKNNNG